MPPKGKKKQVAAGSIAEGMTVAALYKRGYPDHKRQYPFTTLRIIKIALLKVLAVSVIIHVAAVAAPPPTPPGYASVLEEAPSPVAKAGKGEKKSGKTGEAALHFVGKVAPGVAAPVHADGCAGEWTQWVSTDQDDVEK